MTTISSAPSGAPSTGTTESGRLAVAARTLRVDRWWLPPLGTFLGLSAWLIYALVRTALQRNYYVADFHYLSPFYAPCLTASCTEGSAHFGTPFPEFPPVLPYAILILPFVLLFRLTCYYYRKAYYRAFWLSPPACAVTEPHGSYTGETKFPLILQNIHRYFFYAAIVVGGILTYDTVIAFAGEDGGVGVGLGTIILLINVIFVWLYTLSCHSCRHAVGGRLKHFSKHPVRYRLWTWVTKLNTRHMELAWISLATLAITDAYIALLAADVFSDPRIIN